MKPKFNNYYTPLQQSVINRLAEIEQEDADICANCGGEDCICCEIYHDRIRWKSPEELFELDYDPAYEWHDDEELICPCCGEIIEDNNDDVWECDGCGKACHSSCIGKDGLCDKCSAKHNLYDYPFGNPYKD